MSYAQGGLIQATDYNTFAWGGTQGTYTSLPNNIAYVMGQGYGDTGYGQTITAINTVAAGATVTAVQWNGLITTLNKALAHQGSSQIVPNPAITTGNLITYISTVSSSITTINTNRASYYAQGGTVTGTTASYVPSVGATTAFSWGVENRIYFSSAQACRYFFNAGGQLNFYTTATSTGGNTRSNSLATAWQGAAGITNFRNNSNQYSSIGYRQLTPSWTLIRQVNNASYGGSYVQIYVRTDTQDTTLGANGRSVLFYVYGYSPADDAFGGSIVLNPVTTRIDVVYPESTYLTDAWGTPTNNWS